MPTYPNPFKSTTVPIYGIPQPGRVSFTIYDIRGQRGATSYDGTQQPGHHNITWNATKVSSGIYFAQLQSKGHVKIIKMILVK